MVMRVEEDVDIARRDRRSCPGLTRTPIGGSGTGEEYVDRGRLLAPGRADK